MAYLGESECQAVANFTSMFTYNFYGQKFQKRKKDSQVISVFLRFWDLRM